MGTKGLLLLPFESVQAKVLFVFEPGDKWALVLAALNWLEETDEIMVQFRQLTRNPVKAVLLRLVEQDLDRLTRSSRIL